MGVKTSDTDADPDRDVEGKQLELPCAEVP
jgi:hypothetical protein